MADMTQQNLNPNEPVDATAADLKPGTEVVDNPEQQHSEHDAEPVDAKDWDFQNGKRKEQ